MANCKFFLDTRCNNNDVTKPAVLKIAVFHKKSKVLLSLDVRLLPSQWDKEKGQVINHPQAHLLNISLDKKLNQVREALILLDFSTELSKLTTPELGALLRDKLGLEAPALRGVRGAKKDKKEGTPDDPKSVGYWYDRYMSHCVAPRTAQIYKCTKNRINAFLARQDKDIYKLRFEDINKEWLLSFNDFLAEHAPKANGRAPHMRNLRTVNNYAIDNEVTTNYPFRRFSIKREKTKHRDFTVEQLRRIFCYECESEADQRYLDCFKISFLLLGANIIDVCHLDKIENGYIHYIRSKTKKPYTIKIEPETQALIDKYRGEKFLLNYMDNCQHYRSYYGHMYKALKRLSKELHLPDLTSYWARHSWGTIAGMLDIPWQTIRGGLGHGGDTVTDVYVRFDRTKVDVAQRRILDFLLYGIDYRNAHMVATTKPEPAPKEPEEPVKVDIIKHPKHKKRRPRIGDYLKGKSLNGDTPEDNSSEDDTANGNPSNDESPKNEG